MNKTIYCGNCGKKGHLYKSCHLPLISLGIICIKYDNLDLYDIVQNYHNDFSLKIDPIEKNNIINKLKFLMIRRKNSLGYVQFTRGNYRLDNISNINYLEQIFSMMTKDEIKMIRESEFDTIWHNLWILKEMTKFHINEYKNSREKYNLLKQGIKIDNISVNLETILNTTKTEWEEPEWEFPKGRRNLGEKDLECACREFMEETNFKENEYKLLNLKSLSEIFTGNNKINYKYTYYLAQSTSNKSLSLDPNNNYQNIEISDIKWVSYNEASEKIRYHYKERKNILKRICDTIIYSIYLS